MYLERRGTAVANVLRNRVTLTKLARGSTNCKVAPHKFAIEHHAADSRTKTKTEKKTMSHLSVGR